MEERIQHVQQTLIGLGDEFLTQYFLSADNRFRGNQILSRLFSMGHSLELYAKAALVSADGKFPHHHDVAALIVQFDPLLALSDDEIAAGKALYAPDVTNFDIGLQLKHAEALELYLAQYFLKDLKYYFAKNGKIIFPVKHSLRSVNWKYLDLVRRLRLSVNRRRPEQDRELVALIEQLGFEVNPALRVVEPAAAE